LTRGDAGSHLGAALDQKVTGVAGGEQWRGGARRCSSARRHMARGRRRRGAGAP
jgi:hypothetical protein